LNGYTVRLKLRGLDEDDHADNETEKVVLIKRIELIMRTKRYHADNETQKVVPIKRIELITS